MKTFLVTYTVTHRKKTWQKACVVEAATPRKAKDVIAARGFTFKPVKAEKIA